MKDYKRPNDKIHELIKREKLVSLKRGLYIWNSQILPEPFSVANVLYGPSYVSAESALAYHGLIPEQVFTIVSMTLKNSKNFNNPLGNFEYIKLQPPYYAFGIQQVELRENQFSLMATAEKAILDKIVTTSGTIFRSIEAASAFLLENMRMDEDLLKSLNTKEMASWISDAPKKESLKFVIKAIEEL
ncbi:type IV toxin-antitoxin system AbiEi family antitoxin domain-containing protein [Kaistella sp.]|uniref:type IV toxin-antitoxin system AbiEi family antitoxin domain-containing protein n=1 Tax=Kaistella sp. TaxID=2782235 RepID=UPI002F954C83